MKVTRQNVMTLPLQYRLIRPKKLRSYIEVLFLFALWSFYFASINVNWTGSWVAEQFLPEAVAPHMALAFPIIFFTNVFWLIPKFFNRKKWYLYVVISLGLLFIFEFFRSMIFVVALPSSSSIYTEMTGAHSSVFGKLNFLTTNAIFWSFLYRFTRDWIMNQIKIDKLEVENNQLKRDLTTQTTTKIYKEVFSIKKKSINYVLHTDAIVYFKAQGDFVLAVDKNDRKHIINDSLKNIMKQLNPNIFFQINRSEIVSISYIDHYGTFIKNRLEIVLKNSKDLLYTSNSRTPKFRTWLNQRQ